MDPAPRDAQLKGRLAVVTGAARGIGRGAAVGLARRGATLALVDISAAELETTIGLVAEEGAAVTAVRADLRRREEIDRALNEVEAAYGIPDILVNNAAVLHLRAFEETSPDVWDETLGVNLEAAYYLTWRLYRPMVARGGGNVISISSNAGVKPFALETAYCASKYAVEGLFRSLAREAVERGVLVVLATPGKTTKPTSMTEAQFAALRTHERERYADPLVFAEAFGYLAGTSDLSLAGRRFDLFALSELIRAQGWNLPGSRALQQTERDTA